MKLSLRKKDTEKEININVEESKNASPTFAIRRSVVTEKIRSNSKLILDVSERLTKPDEIVVKTQTDLSKKKSSDSYEKVKGLVSASRGLPSIKVTPKNVPRAMRILDNLIKNFKILGYEVKVKDEGLSIEAYGGDTLINIREKSTATLTPNKYGWNDRELTANGKLAVKVGRYGDYEFVDTEKVLVESQIEKILIKIETEFLKRQEEREKWRIYQQEQAELRRIEEAKQKLKDDELHKFISFYNDVHRWKKFMILKEYFEYKKSLKNTEKQWLDWAEKKLEWYNPALDVVDDLLRNVDKDTLEDTSKKKFGW